MRLFFFLIGAVAFVGRSRIMVKHKAKINAIGINIHEKVELVIMFITGDNLVHEEQIEGNIQANEDYGKKVINARKFELI